MRTILHVGPDAWVTTRLQEVLVIKRAQLRGKSVLYPRAPGAKNHTRAFMAVSGVVDTLRFNRGYALAEDQAKLLQDVTMALAQEVASARPDILILSAHQFGTHLTDKASLQALHKMLAPLSKEIEIVAHIEAPSEMLARHYALQVFEGRSRGLTLEHGFLTGIGSWWDQAITSAPVSDPQAGLFPEVQMAPAFIDLKNWVALWEDVFGPGSVTLRPIDRAMLASERVTDEVAAAFGLPGPLGKIDKTRIPRLPSAEWIARARDFNDLLLRLLRKRDHILPRQLWRRFLNEMRAGGDAFDAASLSWADAYFSQDMRGLQTKHPALSELSLPKGSQTKPPTGPAFTGGFRASQYLLAALSRIEIASEEERKSKGATLARLAPPTPQTAATQVTVPKPAADKPKTPTHLPPLAQQNYTKLLTSTYAPHNRLGHVNEEALAAAYTAVPQRVLPEGRSGNVIVGCMKNEAPYILEWVAYHRAIGVDNFLIYTNGCEDGTAELLDRLQEMGILQHRDNNEWKGNSPQQHALNQSLKEPVILNADWIIHIDVDEFMNVRCGNGTLADFYERVPDATNVAMTWRLFGHNGVTTLNDTLVIDQFDTCAPKYCPKPHTVWGFKTMFRNIGAYEKISCHRPNKLIKGREDDVLWVNGSGERMGNDVKRTGWRNSKKSIGYDLLQLNHYALRSAESFLIKRQRGRALHVDRSIGLNYWIRMDWSDFRDITIKRNVPRVSAERERLLQDDTLRHWHEKGLAWHRAKADELHKIPEFEDLYQKALTLRLNETERVAYALALDMES